MVRRSASEQGIPTELVGILNLTPDSTSGDGRFKDPAGALAHAERLFGDGAAVVDVGAESTRPGATPLSTAEEWERLAPVLPMLIERHPGKVSLDTYHPETVRRAFEHGSVIVNDVTGLRNPEMVAAVVESGARCIVSHLPTGDIQEVHRARDVSTADEVREDLLRRVAELETQGVDRERIILDPGIGFGKTADLNRELLGFAAEVPGFPVMIGYSRKKFLGDDEQRRGLPRNLEAGRIAVSCGARYLRVHDVAGHVQLVGHATKSG
jgi:dihydropteroate synthase